MGMVNKRCLQGFPSNQTPLSPEQMGQWGIRRPEALLPSDRLREHSYSAYGRLAKVLWRRTHGDVEPEGPEYADWLAAVAAKCEGGLGTHPQYLGWVGADTGPLGENCEFPL